MRRLDRFFSDGCSGVFSIVAWLVFAASGVSFVAGLITGHWLWVSLGFVMFVGYLWAAYHLYWTAFHLHRQMSRSQSGPSCVNPGPQSLDRHGGRDPRNPNPFP
jgi:hypothetical protein